ncbi:hypothetical protein PG994_001317 [Apiospora phragmitis]|uniref:Uncharacterized protein n=1 Tax=Apiospora phragmitis TaxID=2905665 RepID=A0ABR1WT60_9PEZI
MLKSRLLYCNLLIGLATIQAWARGGHNETAGFSDNHAQAPETIEAVIWERVQYIVVEREAVPKRVILETLPNPTVLPARDVRSLQMPKPTPAPQKRQDQGQINALSGEIQRLSQSIQFVSQTASSISQASQSLRQSADQAIRSANQNADQASQALSRTQSSASSAVSQASRQADDRIAQASSSFSSQISANLASVRSSASSDISVASASARASAASAMNIAASQIQQARADASGVRVSEGISSWENTQANHKQGDATNLVAQVQSNSVSAQNLAIIVSVSVVGSVIVTAIIAFLVMRCRRRGRSNREAPQGSMDMADEKSDPYDDGKPIAVQGVPPSAVPPSGARFNPKMGGTYPMDKLKLPGFSPFTAKKEAFSNVGLATSDYSDGRTPTQTANNNPDVYGVSSESFRLQKPPAISRAETVRIIRVNSRKKEEQEQQKVVDEPPAPAPIQRKPAPSPQQWPELPSPAPKSPLPPTPRQRQQQKQQEDEELAPPPSRSASGARYSVITPKTPEFRSGAGDDNGPGWRPPSTRRSTRASIVSAAARFKFRDSSDMESDAELPTVPPPVVTTTAAATNSSGNGGGDDGEVVRPPKGGVSMMSMMSSQGMGPAVRPGGSPERPGAPAIPTLRKSSEVLDREPMIPSLLPPPIINPNPVAPTARTGPSFATFPTVRKQGPPPSTVLSWPKPKETETGPRTSAEFFGAARG